VIEIAIASRNSDKIREIKAALNLDFVKWLTYEEFPSWPPLPEETGRNFEENARAKALVLARFTGKYALADDSGLEVYVLNGKPGVRSARFAGSKATYEDNNRKLLRLLSNVPYNERLAHFRCVLCLTSPEGDVYLTEGLVEGHISFEPRGRGGFGYDPLFISLGYKKTMAELSLDEKNRISHRGQALRRMKAVLENLASPC
jgi:XTP/dITP diphosphohydrolase